MCASKVVILQKLLILEKEAAEYSARLLERKAKAEKLKVWLNTFLSILKVKCAQLPYFYT